MAEKKPQFKPEVNIAYLVELLDDKCFYSGENEYGKYFGYNIKVSGDGYETPTELVWFANNDANEQVKVFSKGSQLNLLWKEVKQEGKKPYRVWQIRQAIFDNSGREAHAQEKVNLLDDKEARESYIKDMENTMFVCLSAARNVADLYNRDPKSEGYELTREDIRAIGISFLIEWRKKYA